LHFISFPEGNFTPGNFCDRTGQRSNGFRTVSPGFFSSTVCKHSDSCKLELSPGGIVQEADGWKSKKLMES